MTVVLVFLDMPLEELPLLEHARAAVLVAVITILEVEGVVKVTCEPLTVETAVTILTLWLVVVITCCVVLLASVLDCGVVLLPASVEDWESVFVAVVVFAACVVVDGAAEEGVVEVSEVSEDAG